MIVEEPIKTERQIITVQTGSGRVYSVISGHYHTYEDGRTRHEHRRVEDLLVDLGFILRRERENHNS